MNAFKKVTHVLALGYTAVAAFAFSDAGQAIVKQYPKAAIVVTLLSLVGSLYHTPRQP
jgi:hypothetical protein